MEAGYFPLLMKERLQKAFFKVLHIQYPSNWDQIDNGEDLEGSNIEMDTMSG